MTPHPTNARGPTATECSVDVTQDPPQPRGGREGDVRDSSRQDMAAALQGPPPASVGLATLLRSRLLCSLPPRCCGDLRLLSAL